MSYEYKTTPFEHQRKTFEESRDLASYGILWEQGCGKTKPTIDTAAYLYEKGEIDAVIVVAPSGVHRNWLSDELPVHLPDRVARVSRAHVWNSQKARNVGVTKDREALLKHKGLAWLLLSYDGAVTDIAKKYLWKFLRQRRCLYVMDEGHNIKTPKAKRTKALVASGKYAPYRRLLTGTPVAVGPFDLYSQLKFLDEDLWKRHELDSFRTFKFHFGDWFTRAECEKELGYDPGFDKLIEYKNLDELKAILQSVSSRVTKDEVLDLPPKLYSTRYFELEGQQASLYEQLRDEYEAELEDGAMIDGNLAIVRLLRLQQIISGYAYTDDDEEPVRLLGNRNPLMDQVEEVAEGLSHPAIIWSRFTKDIDQIMDRLGKSAVRYDGTMDDDACERSKLAFQGGDAQFFVANAQKGGTGLTLVQARTVMYATNSFKLIERLQSEDRAHRIGQEHPVNYIDFEGQLPGGRQTVARHIIKSLRRKFDIAAQITGDTLKEWL